jgi:hypothetical protein
MFSATTRLGRLPGELLPFVQYIATLAVIRAAQVTI